MEERRLFRKEAVDYQNAKWMGKALLTRGYPAWSVLFISMVFITILVLFLIYGDYTRRINVIGEITTQPRAINLFSPQQGIIVDTQVKVGDRVTKGTPLYQLDVSRVTHSGNVTENTTGAINSQITHIEKIIATLEHNKKTTLNTLNQQLEQYYAAHAKSQELVDNAERGMEDMRDSMVNYEEYQQKGLINKEQFNNQRYLYYQQQNAFQSLKTQVIQESLQITRMQSELITQSADFDNQISQYQYQLNDLQRQLTEVDAKGLIIINAPSDGKIESLSVTEGQMVNPGDSLAQLIPTSHDSYHLVLWLPNDSVPYIHPGDKINIRYEAYPYQKFGQFPGRISSISRVPASAQEMSTYNSALLLQNNTANQSYYKVMVTLENSYLKESGEAINLTDGMKAEATLFLEKRPIYQWMLSPFYDIKKSITGPVNG